MLELASVFVLFCSLSANASAIDIGKEVKAETLNGKPSFGVQFAHDSDTGILVAVNVIGKELTDSGCLSTLAYRFYNSATQTYVSDWAGIDYHTSCAIPSGTYPIQASTSDAKVVKAVISQLKNIKLVLSLNYFGTQYSANHYIDLGALCTTAPENFIDLSTSKTGCDVQLSL